MARQNIVAPNEKQHVASMVVETLRRVEVLKLVVPKKSSDDQRG
jgi:hypothetical protein